MYRVMIVDDEPSIRKGLVHFIPWTAMDCEITSIAIDGVDAMEKLAEDTVDIVITDIKMPGADGLELSKYIYHHYPTIKVIILTAFDEFTYSQSAIKYNVVDFILKPTSTDKLVEAVEKCKLMIKTDRERQIKIKNLEEKLSKQTQEVQEHFILKVINHIETNPNKIYDKCLSLNIELDNYFVIVLQINNDKFHDTTSSAIEAENNNTFAIKGLLNSLLQDYTYYTVVVNENHICTYINFKTHENPSILQTITNLCNEIICILKNLIKSKIVIGISNQHTDVIKIADGYQEALKALSSKFYIEKNIFIYTTLSKHNNSIDTSEMNVYFKEMKNLLKLGKYQESKELLKKIFQIQKNINENIENTKSMSVLLYSLIMGLASRQKDKSFHIFEEGKSICSSIWQSKSIDAIYDILFSVLKSTFINSSVDPLNDQSIIEKINDYIHEHYHENLQLQSIAKFVHLNSSYLSRLYKKETTMTLTEKITSVRMEKAKMLLSTTHLKVYEIADLVGIDNPTYFSILFKKYTNLYPKEYRSSTKPY